MYFRSFHGRIHLWTYNNANIDGVRYQNKNNIILFAWVLTSSLDLINSLWLKVRVNEPIIMLVLDTWWHNQNGGIFWFLGYQFLSFLEKNIGDLKFNFFEGRMTNKTIITLKINSWKKHQKMNCIFKSLVFCIFDKQLVI